MAVDGNLLAPGEFSRAVGAVVAHNEIDLDNILMLNEVEHSSVLNRIARRCVACFKTSSSSLIAPILSLVPLGDSGPRIDFLPGNVTAESADSLDLTLATAPPVSVERGFAKIVERVNRIAAGLFFLFKKVPCPFQELARLLHQKSCVLARQIRLYAVVAGDPFAECLQKPAMISSV